MFPEMQFLHTQTLSLHATELIVRYIFNALTPEQSVQLDEWIGESDDNMKIFDRLTDLDLPLPKWPDGIERDEKACWTFNLHARTIIKSLDEMLTTEEERELNDWLAADPANAQLYTYLQDGDAFAVHQWLDRLPLLCNTGIDSTW